MLRHSADRCLDTSGLRVKLGYDVLTHEQTLPLFPTGGVSCNTSRTVIVAQNINVAGNAPYSEDNKPLSFTTAIRNSEPKRA
jgi:hypothetical protein